MRIAKSPDAFDILRMHGVETAVRHPVSGFVQFTPASPAGTASCDDRLRGISVSFPDGISLTLSECTVADLASLFRVYSDRKEVGEVCLV